jgi:hypothetical protein
MYLASGWPLMSDLPATAAESWMVSEVAGGPEAELHEDMILVWQTTVLPAKGFQESHGSCNQ